MSKTNQQRQPQTNSQGPESAPQAELRSVVGLRFIEVPERVDSLFHTEDPHPGVLINVAVICEVRPGNYIPGSPWTMLRLYRFDGQVIYVQLPYSDVLAVIERAATGDEVITRASDLT